MMEEDFEVGSAVIEEQEAMIVTKTVDDLLLTTLDFGNGNEIVFKRPDVKKTKGVDNDRMDMQVGQFTFSKPNEKIRHCAFCLSDIPIEEVKYCAKCRKRVYCSKACQIWDWSKKEHQYAQGHKDWCGQEYGEQDLDWEVDLVEGKGRGIVAKRDYPANSRIIVEGFNRERSLNDPLYVALLPHLSQFVNHECNANAAKFTIDDDVLQTVVITYAKREIKKGEEICVSYTDFNSSKDVCKIPCFINVKHKPGDTVAERHRRVLKEENNIICAPNCFCRQEEIQRQVETNWKLEFQIAKYNERPSSEYIEYIGRKKLQCFDKLIQGLELVKTSQHDIVSIQVAAASTAVTMWKDGTIEKADSLMKEADKFWVAIHHPKTYVKHVGNPVGT